MTRPDADGEIVRRNNVAARLQPTRIVLAGLSAEACDQFVGRFPAKKTLKISSLGELIAAGVVNAVAKNQTFTWGRNNIGVGLLLALRAKKLITFTDDSTPQSVVASQSGHLVVCEQGDQLAQVIAANYAFSLGAGFCLIPEMSEEETDVILDQLYGLYDHHEESPTDVLQAVRQSLRSHAANVSLAGIRSITFVTQKLPWGFAFPEVPTTHLFAYPDLGTCIASGLQAEQRGSPGIRVAMLIDPGEVNAGEIDAAVDALRSRSVFIRGVCSRAATVYEVTRAVELYPYDLLLVSTHCGDASGWRWTYEYTDSEGRDRTLVIDVAISVSVVPGSEKLDVMQFTRFVSLDGVDWNDSEKKKSLYVGTAINDYIERTRDPERLQPVKKELINRVVGSAALKMSDGNFIAVPRSLANYGCPIVLNNACASWHRLAGNFVFGNARAYVGTLFSVSDVEAQEVMTKLMAKYFGRPLAIALWHAQNDVYGDSPRRPYIIVGTHMQRLRATSSDAPVDIYKQLVTARDRWRRDLEKTGPSEEQRHLTARDYASYLDKEAKGVYKRWIAPRGEGV